MQQLTQYDWTLICVAGASAVLVCSFGIFATLRRNRAIMGTFEARMNWVAEIANLGFYLMIFAVLLPSQVVERYFGSSFVLIGSAVIFFVINSFFSLWQLHKLKQQAKSISIQGQN